MHVGVAASGGRDSTALLHCTARWAREAGAVVHALHVDHGLQPQAARWRDHVRDQVGRWRRAGWPVEFHSAALSGGPPRGQSVEAWARAGRYEQLAAMARGAGCSVVLLAHHRRDQAETVLLQMLRGAGPAGLAAMPRVVVRDGVTWLRPWLEVPRPAIEAYLRRHRLSFVDDPSNADTRFDRNRLRREVWPALSEAFPGVESTLVAVARRAHEAAECLRALALEDAARAADGDALVIERWLALSPERRANLLRHWLRDRVSGGVPETLVVRLLEELPRAGSGRWPVPGAMLRAHRGRLAFIERRVPEPLEGGVAKSRRVDVSRDLSRPGMYRFDDWGGSFIVTADAPSGLPAERLRRVACRPRIGGEAFCLGAGRPARSLKKQYQALGVPPWGRDGPLLYDGDVLLYVPGLGIDARVAATSGEPRLGVEWHPDVSLPSESSP